MYVELHARSAFSFLEGASLPEALVGTAAELGMPAMALLDRDGFYGAPRFHMAAKKLGLRAHVGAEITVCDTVFRNSGLGNSGVTRYPLLAVSRNGYQNLCRLITRMKLRAPKGEGSVTPEELEEFSTGLVCLTGGDEGPLAEALQRGGQAESRRATERLMRTFGPRNVYVELQRHYDRTEEVRNQAAVAVARACQLPLLATNGVRHATPADRELLDVLTCVRTHTQLETAGRLLARNHERFLKPAREMQRLFADLPEAIANTVELSSRVEYSLADLGYEFPRYPVPEGETMNSFLRQRTEEGMRRRYGVKQDRGLRERARRQIERELALIEKLELAGYFLIVWDIIQFCGKNNILVQGRGSAANSAVCYSLGITAVDPVGMDLLFERFLSEERGEWPDIDLDLPSGDDRERAIQYVYERYGKLGAAMTANVITYRGRSAAREAGKVLGFDPRELDRLAGLVNSFEYKAPTETFDRYFEDAGFDLRHPRVRKFFEMCLAMQDLPRHLGQHSGGMVICQGQLDCIVPLEPASMPGRVVVQWDKDDCADMGIIKVDLLGLGMMALIKECIHLIRDHQKQEVDLAQLPAGDPLVYQALQKADTVGMFQIESRAQMSCLPRLQPTCFYDIVVQVAIIRPGPIVGQMLNPYLKRRQGKEEVTYAHPALEPVLERTLGVPLFQEQLLRMAMIAANFSGGEAEELRRAFGFKRSEKRMEAIQVKLRDGMQQNEIAPQAQELILNAISSFALYGFPESHAASFALIAYASAFLKCHHLAAFTAALLNNQPMGFYNAATIVKDAQRHGLKVRPIDVMKSGWGCGLEAASSKAVPSSQFPVPSKAVHGSQFTVHSCEPSDVGNDSTMLADSNCALRTGHWALEDANCALDHAANWELGTENWELKKEHWELRLGLRYAKGLRQVAAEAIVRERNRAPFTSVDDLTRRVPELRKNELVTLAEIGALNSLGGGKSHRRDALWQVERATRASGPLFGGRRREDANKQAIESQESTLSAIDASSLDARPTTHDDPPSPLAPMNQEERLVADYRGSGLTVGPHPMAYHRAEMNALRIRPAIELQGVPNNTRVRIAGSVIARQRPGTAKGFVFLSLEDETGISNAIIVPDLYEKNRFPVISERFLMIEGILQNLEGVISVRAEKVEPLHITAAATVSHDFH